MDIETAIFTRRSVRVYTDKPVEKETIEKIIKAGMWAPSACNVQGWKFIVIDDKGVFQKILSAGAASFLKNVNQAILVLYDNRTDNQEYNDYIQSASACIENMLLFAHSLNVGTCWINFLPDRKTLKEILGIPWNYEPIALISIGYYDRTLHQIPRKYNLSDVISYNHFQFPVEKKGKKYVKLKVRRTLRKVYYKIPFKSSLKKIIDKHEKKFKN